MSREVDKEKYDCLFMLPRGVSACRVVTYYKEDSEGRLWAGNDENENQVNFCPFCGHVAELLVGSEKIDEDEVENND